MTITNHGPGSLRTTRSTPSNVGHKFGRIVLAFMLRDMRTRFGRSYISYLISLAYPLVHLSILFTAYILSHKIAPIGDDPSVFAFTGLAPYILCLYPARFTAMAIIQNKPLLMFPIVSPIHLIISRATLEAISAFVVFFIFFFSLKMFGLAQTPSDLYMAAEAIIATIYLSIGIGVFGVFLCAFHLMAGLMTVIFSIIGLYLTSGAIIPLTFMSHEVREILWYNPLRHSVELLRCAYYGGFGSDTFSASYVAMIASFLLMLGLLGERMVRGKFLV